jgi:hypothetical protein
MKDLTLSTAAVVAIAVVLGLLFHAAYPRVEPSAELAGLFVFVAAVLRLLIGKAWAAWRRKRNVTTPERAP